MVLAAVKQYLVLPNLVINSSCALTKVDARFITSLLARIRRQGLEFEELRIPIWEVLAPSQRKLSSKDYANLAALQALLSNSELQLDSPYLAAEQSEKIRLPMLKYLWYEKQKGWLRVRLADELRPYLEQSGVAYTSAPYYQLAKLGSPLARRLYWLLRENAAQGTRTLELAQLAWMLKLPLRGFNLSLFCRRELLAAQQQLAATDLACTIKLEYVRQKSQLHAAHFQFTPLKSGRSGSVLPDIDSKPGGAGLFGFGLEEENALIQGVLMLLRFVAGAVCVVAAINGVGVG